MLARAQRLLTIGALSLVVLWFAVCWRAGEPVWAWVGLAVLLSGHALVLGLEFGLMAHVNRRHRDEFAPPATLAQLVAAWWGESRAAPRVFCWRQPFRSRRWPDHLPADARGRRGVVLVHGFVCNRGLWNRWLPRLRAAGVPHVAVDLEPVFASIDDYAPIVDAAVRRVEQATGLPPLIVAHSMGGLAVRGWMASQGGAADARVHRVLTLRAPHAGTWLARWAFSPNARQMRSDSRWLARLREREPATRAGRFTCFYSHCDNIVFPPTTAMLAGSDNRHLAGVAHVQMADRPEPFDEAMKHLVLR